MKKRMKTRVWLPCIFILQSVIFWLIALIFGFDLENSVYASVGAVIMSSTIIGFLIKTIWYYRKKTDLVWLFCFPIALFLFLAGLFIYSSFVQT